jgi:hypothetical protein
MLAIEPMGTTVTFIFYAVGIALWVMAGLGLKPSERMELVGFGLAAFFFPTFWSQLAAL